MSEHTKGRLSAVWQGFGSEYDLEAEDGGTVAEDLDEFNARRLAACWNHFDGVETDSIESMPTFNEIHWSYSQSQGDLAVDRDKAMRELAAARAQNEKLLAMVQEQDRMLGHKACATKECRELLAARALLREVITETGTISYIEKVARARDYLDACDTLGGAPNAG